MSTAKNPSHVTALIMFNKHVAYIIEHDKTTVESLDEPINKIY